MKQVPSGDGPLLGGPWSGAPGALWEEWERHQAELRRCCRRWMGGRTDDAEDALSTALLRAWESLPARRADVVNVRAWLLRLTHNVCIDLHRAQRRRLRVFGGLSDPERPASDGSSRSPEEELLRREVTRSVRLAIDGLPATLRQPVLLRFFREMPHRDIADRLHVTPESVRKRLQYARGVLGRRLQGLVGEGRGTPSPGRRTPPSRRPGATPPPVVL